MSPTSIITAAPDDTFIHRSEEQTKMLLAEVEQYRPVIEEGALEADRDRALSLEVTMALRGSGLWRMRAPKEVGGLESSIVTQIEVIEAIAAIDASTAWCTMLQNNGVSKLAEFFPDSVMDVLFANGQMPLAAGVAAPRGRAEKVEGGYRLYGTWRFASGIARAEWVRCRSFVDGDETQLLNAVVAVPDVRIEDTWNVLGLRGTSSSTFSLDGTFVPDQMVLLGELDTQLRGSRGYTAEGFIVTAYEHLAIALGIGKRALEELVTTLVRSASDPGSAAHREVVHTELSRLTLELEGVRSASLDYFRWIESPAASGSGAPSASDREKTRALSTLATETATRCVRAACDRAGAAAIGLPNILERLLRDITTARAHILVRDSSLAAHGQAILEDHGAQIESSAPRDKIFFR